MQKKILSLVGLLAMALNCSTDDSVLRPLPRPEEGPYALAPLKQPDQNQAATLAAGTITLSKAAQAALNPHKKQVLFIIAKTDQPGPPLAVKRLIVEVSDFPLAFQLTQADLMIPGTHISGTIHLTARLDFDGSAGPITQGDWQGESQARVTPGQYNLRIEINRPH